MVVRALGITAFLFHEIRVAEASWKCRHGNCSKLSGTDDWRRQMQRWSSSMNVVELCSGCGLT
jgi:hypothetical protein